MYRYKGAEVETVWQIASRKTKEEIYNVVKEDIRLVGWREADEAAESRDKEIYS